MRIKDKKAIMFLSEEVVKIILAVLCILLLVMLAVQLYSIFTRSNELEQAKATLNELLGKADMLDESGKHTDMLILNPGMIKGHEWRILAYPDNKEVCICPADKASEQKDTCKRKGVCQKRDYEVGVWGAASYCPNDNLVNCIELSKGLLPREITLINQGGKINLKLGKYDYIEIKDKSESKKVAINEEEKTIDFIDNLYPTTSSFIDPKINWINDPSVIRMYYDSSGNYIDLSSHSQQSNFYSNEIIGRIESDGVVWFSRYATSYLTLSTEIFVSPPESLSLIDYELPVEKDKPAPEPSSSNMKYIIIKRYPKTQGGLEYSVYLPIFRTNLKLNFEDLKNKLINVK